MAIDENEIIDLIDAGNFQGLKEHLKNESRDIQTLLNPKIFVKAFNKFIESDAKNLTNSFNILSILHAHFYDPNRHARYKGEDKYKDIDNLFNIYTKTISHKKINIDEVSSITGIEGFNINNFSKKYELYEKKQDLRKIYKFSDNIIERDFIYKIKYPENTNFLRKLLHLPPKRPSIDIVADFKKDLPDFIDNLRNSIKNSSEFKDNKGRFILTERELGRVIYERLSLKATKQLGLHQSRIDKMLTENNTQNLVEILNKTKKYSPEIIKYANELEENIQTSIPPHLIEWEKLDMKIFKLKTEDSEETKSIKEEYKGKTKSIYKEQIFTLKSEIKKYEDEPFKEASLEKSLNSLLKLNEELKEYGIKYSQILLTENEVNELDRSLKKVQNETNTKLLDQHNKYKPSKKLTEFEKKAILLIINGMFTEADRKLLSEFFEYATGNKKFNKRLGQILKTDNEFISNYREQIEEIYKYSYKSSLTKEVIEICNKFDIILKKIDNDKNYQFKESEKITIKELGEINKFIEIKNLIEYANECQLEEKSELIKNLINTHTRVEDLHKKITDLLDTGVNYNNGDIVMDIAERYHDLNHHNKLSLKEKFKDIVTPYSHAALAYKEKDSDETRISEIWREYQQDVLGGKKSLISEGFRLYPHNLIQNESIKKEILQALNINENKLKDELYEIYQETSREIQAEFSKDVEALKKANLENDDKKREKAGIADFIPFGHKSKKSIKDWADNILANADKFIAEQIKESPGDNGIICSEFDAKMIVLILAKLEQKLLAKIKEKNPEFISSEKGLLKLAFNEFEDLSKVHPTRLISELKKTGAIEKLPDPEIVQNLISFGKPVNKKNGLGK